jgi:DNA protecting protein DprA
VRLGMALDFRARDPGRLWKTLELSDEQLIAALGGRRRAELRRRHAIAIAASDSVPERAGGVKRMCRHRADYPRRLREDPLAPAELHVAGGASSLQKSLDEPVVAIVGARRCTDYGMEVARCLGRELAGAGVCVLGELCDGISYGALLGATQAGHAGIAVAAGGLDRCSPRLCAPLYRRLAATGCAVSELPCGAPGRSWCELARVRIAALLAQLVVVVEAGQGSRELAGAHLASARGKTVAAVPGRITSPASCGTHDLLKAGAPLVRGPGDVLDLLCRSRPPRRPSAAQPGARGTVDRSRTGSVGIEPHLGALLRHIGEGRDTIAKLEAERDCPDALLRDLAQLELRGIVRRGDGGRYVPCAVTPCG